MSYQKVLHYRHETAHIFISKFAIMDSRELLYIRTFYIRISIQCGDLVSLRTFKLLTTTHWQKFVLAKEFKVSSSIIG